MRTEKRASAKRAPWPLTDLSLFDVAEVDGQFDPHRLMFGFRLVSGQTIYLHVVHDPDGFRVHVSQEQ